MKYWIGVVGSPNTYERFITQEDSWFCMSKSCEVGDYVLMYASKKVAGIKKSGVFGFYQVSNKDEAKDGDCRVYGIFSGTGERPVYVALKLIGKLKMTIPFATIKTSSRLSNTTFVRRKFQATYFTITESEYKSFVALAKKVNLPA
jgi:predicted RNA-binding protein with PUA-like domain